MSGLRTWAVATLLAVAMAFMLGLSIGAAHGAELQPAGSRCTWADEFGTTWAVTVAYVATGADGSPWAWATIDADPRRVVRMPVRDLRGCHAGAQA